MQRDGGELIPLRGTFGGLTSYRTRGIGRPALRTRLLAYARSVSTDITLSLSNHPLSMLLSSTGTGLGHESTMWYEDLSLKL